MPFPPDPACSCLSTEFQASDFVQQHLGLDPTAGRFAEVSLERCLYCDRWWLHYYVVYESFSGSGRWFRGTIPASIIPRLNAMNAANLFAALPWYFVGGSYYDGVISRHIGPLPL